MFDLLLFVSSVCEHPSLAHKAASAGDASILKAFLSRKPEAVESYDHLHFCVHILYVHVYTCLGTCVLEQVYFIIYRVSWYMLECLHVGTI